jgi:(S)-mandelate dehydrogenase
LLGRAPLYGLASRGGAGVREVLALMMQEMHIAMRLLGCGALAQLGPGLVERAAWDR